MRTDIDAIVTKIDLLELSPRILARLYEPFPLPLRMPDAIHVASLHCLFVRDRKIRFASYDERMIKAALALGIPLCGLS